MEIILKTAMSLDGNIDDESAQRRIFSSPEDRLAVDTLRSQVDGILIGGNTLRKDNPGLRVRDEALRDARLKSGKSASPRRIVLTRSGKFDAASAIFEGEDSPVLMCLVGDAPLSPDLEGRADVLRIPEGSEALSLLLSGLKELGIERLLVEGGSEVLSAFLAEGKFNRLRISVAPVILAQEGAANWRSLPSIPDGLRLERVERLGSCSVLHYLNP